MEDIDQKIDKKFENNEKSLEIKINNMTAMMSLMRKENEVILAKQGTPEGKIEVFEEKKEKLEKYEKNGNFDEVLNES